MNIELFRLHNLVKCKIIKRPSKHIKSPYVADIELINDNGENTTETTQFLGHTAALGCCGLVESGSICYAEKTDGKSKCDYRIYLSEIITKGENVCVGVYPKLAETLAGIAIEKGLIYGLNAETITREKKIMNSRFDFLGKVRHSDDYYILEVKNVPLANYEDMDAKSLQKQDFTERKWNEKVAYFPDGYRKKKSDTVSPRAVKHIQELQKIREKEPKLRCILLFVIQRNDVNRFQPSVIDPIYREAVIKAHKVGVEIRTLQVCWKDGICYYMNNNLPINLEL